MPEKRADFAIAEFLSEHGYHPRSSKHGDALCHFLVADLLDNCATFRASAERGTIAFTMNHTFDKGSPDQWNMDLIVGPPIEPVGPLADRIGVLAKGAPSEVWIAIDAKTIMTEHGKARRNRQRDLNSLHGMLHRKNPRTIVGGLIMVNMAPRFQTPLERKSKGPNVHKNVERTIAEIVTMMSALPVAAPETGTPGLEALGVIVVEHSNVQGDVTRLVSDSPAPRAGEPLSYSTFLRRLCEAFTARFP